MESRERVLAVKTIRLRADYECLHSCLGRTLAVDNCEDSHIRMYIGIGFAFGNRSIGSHTVSQCKCQEETDRRGEEGHREGDRDREDRSSSHQLLFESSFHLFLGLHTTRRQLCLNRVLTAGAVEQSFPSEEVSIFRHFYLSLRFH